MNIRPAPATPEAIPHPLTAYKPVKRSLKEKVIGDIITFAFKPKTPQLKALQKVSASQVVIMH